MEFLRRLGLGLGLGLGIVSKVKCISTIVLKLGQGLYNAHFCGSETHCAFRRRDTKIAIIPGNDSRDVLLVGRRLVRQDIEA